MSLFHRRYSLIMNSMPVPVRAISDSLFPFIATSNTSAFKLLQSNQVFIRLRSISSGIIAGKRNSSLIMTSNHGIHTCGPDKKAIEDLKFKLLSPMAEKPENTSQKVTIVGAGNVGMACAVSILTQGVSSDICLTDYFVEKAKGEALDLSHGAQYIQSAKIVASEADYVATAHSKVVVVTAGVPQKTGESRLDLLQRNTDVFKSIIPKLVEFSPHAIFLVVTNPVDILTYVTWKLSGLPKTRVFGSGTNLDTARFRYNIAHKLGVAPESCEGWIIGEHGDSSVAVWSTLSVGGVLLRHIDPTIGTENDPANWKEVHAEVVNGAYEIQKMKGYTNWAIGLGVSDIVSSILKNKNKIHCVSVPAKTMYGIEKETYLSLPCVVGDNGYKSIIKQVLSSEEEQQLHKSADLLAEYQEQIVF